MVSQAILFDFWQTLFEDTSERDTIGKRLNLVRNYIAERGYDGGLDIEGAYQMVKPRFWQIYHAEQRTPLVSERLGWMLDELGVTLKPIDLEELAIEFGNLGILMNPKPTENIRNVLEALQPRFALGIVSDTGFTPGRVLRQQMERHGLLEYFTAFAFSDETGRAKPHRLQFENALEQVGVSPGDAIHCGDLPDHDVRGANELGITSVLYTGCHKHDPGEFIPDFTISDWRELPHIVAQVFG